MVDLGFSSSARVYFALQVQFMFMYLVAFELLYSDFATFT